MCKAILLDKGCKKMSIEQNLEVSLLLEIYGNLLTQKQQDILSEFYNDNISISEIAQTHDSSRQAVNDLIKRSVKVLQDYEKKLHLLKKLNKNNSKRCFIKQSNNGK